VNKFSRSPRKLERTFAAYCPLARRLMQYLFLQLFPANKPALADFASFIFETPDMVAAKSSASFRATRRDNRDIYRQQRSSISNSRDRLPDARASVSIHAAVSASANSSKWLVTAKMRFCGNRGDRSRQWSNWRFVLIMRGPRYRVNTVTLPLAQSITHRPERRSGAACYPRCRAGSGPRLRRRARAPASPSRRCRPCSLWRSAIAK